MRRPDNSPRAFELNPIQKAVRRHGSPGRSARDRGPLPGGPGDGTGLDFDADRGWVV